MITILHCPRAHISEDISAIDIIIIRIEYKAPLVFYSAIKYLNHSASDCRVVCFCQQRKQQENVTIQHGPVQLPGPSHFTPELCTAGRLQLSLQHDAAMSPLRTGPVHAPSQPAQPHRAAGRSPTTARRRSEAYHVEVGVDLH